MHAVIKGLMHSQKLVVHASFNTSHILNTSQKISVFFTQRETWALANGTPIPHTLLNANMV